MSLATMYDKDLDLLEVMESGVNSYGIEKNEFMTLYLEEGSNRLVGFILEIASEHLKYLECVARNMRLSGILKMLRTMKNKGQEEFAIENDIGIRTLQRFESGEGNPTLENLGSIVDNNSEYDFVSYVFKPTKEFKAS